MTTEEARTYFKEKGFTYKDLTSGDICSLAMLLNKHLKLHNKEGKASICSLRLSDKIRAKYNTNGVLKACYLYVNSHYFTRRECISFHSSGFIGFTWELINLAHIEYSKLK